MSPTRPGHQAHVSSPDAAAVCQVVDLAPAGDGTIVHLRLPPGPPRTTGNSSNGHWQASGLRLVLIPG